MTERDEKPKEGFFQKVKHLFKHDNKDENEYMDENTIGVQNDTEISRPIQTGVTYPNPSNQSNINEGQHQYMTEPKTTGDFGSEQYVQHTVNLLNDNNLNLENQNKDLEPKKVITTIKKETILDQPRQKKEKLREGEHQMKQPKQKEKEVIRLVPTGESNLEGGSEHYKLQVEEPIHKHKQKDPNKNLEKDRSGFEENKQREYEHEKLKQKPKEVDLITTVQTVKPTEPIRNVEMDRNIQPINKPKEVIQTTKTVTTTESRRDENQLQFKPVIKEVTKTIEKEIIYEKKKDEHLKEEVKESKPILKEVDLVFEKDRNLEETNKLKSTKIMDEKVNLLPEKRENVSTFQQPQYENRQHLTNTGLINSPTSDAKVDQNKGDTVVKIVEKQIGNDKDIHIHLNDKKNESQGLNTGNF